jgi:UDP-N-acetylglucosamine 2-epimerase (non-hydrolysing)
MTGAPSPGLPKVLCVVGARPNFMKIAPLMAVLRAPGSRIDARLVHTGQHYDARMNTQVFEDLGIPEPDVNLEVGSGSHAVQTAEIMKRFEAVIDAEQPAAVLVVGDVNSTIACALVASKKNVAVIHVEAGLRSYDRAMPEEINRVLTDQISDILFTTERSAEANLVREGIDPSRVRFVGNVMIDTLRHNLKKAVPAADFLGRAGISAGPKEYVLLTLHRPSNVDDATVLRGLLGAVAEVSRVLPVIFPAHPRTKNRIGEYGLTRLIDPERVVIVPPAGYLEILGLMRDARVVLTDSGGLQEETTALGTPCITLRANTERPITVTEGTNTMAGQDPAKILAVFRDVMATGGKAGRIPEFWDGEASVRIARVLEDWLHARSTRAAA